MQEENHIKRTGTMAGFTSLLIPRPPQGGIV